MKAPEPALLSVEEYQLTWSPKGLGQLDHGQTNPRWQPHSTWGNSNMKHLHTSFFGGSPNVQESMAPMVTSAPFLNLSSTLRGGPEPDERLPPRKG